MDCGAPLMRIAGNRAIGTAAVFLGMALVVIDAGITNVALPTISRSLEVEPARAILVTSAYQLALLMGLLPAAHIAARTGSRKLFRLGLCIFIAASLTAALAPGFAFLVAARFLQGVGGAAILALGVPLLRSALGRDRLGAAIGWNALNVAVCAAAGPAVGAVVLAAASWPVLFLLNLPLGILAVIACRALPADSGRGTAVDLPAIMLHAASAALLFVAFERVLIAPFAAAASALGAAATFAFLYRRELRKAAPLLPLDLMNIRSFRLAAGASVLCFVAQSAALVALPFYLERNLREQALVTGAVIACWPLSVAFTSRIASRLAESISAGSLCAIGATIFSAGLAAMAAFHAGIGLTAVCAAVCGVGFGLFQVPNNRNLFLTAPEHRSEAAGGMQGTARLAGQTSGAVLVSLVFSSSTAIAAPQIAFTLAAAFALASAMLSLRQLERMRQEAFTCEA